MYAEVPGKHQEEPGIEIVNINSVNFTSNYSTIIANLKTSSNKAAIMVPYKVDMGSDGNIMPFNIFTKLFPRTGTDELVATKDTPKLRTYNHTTITQLGRCKVKIENNHKCKKCIFFVVPGNREVLLGMSDTELLNILNINCKTIGTDKEEKGVNCNMRKDSVLSAGSEQYCINTGPERSCAKTNSNRRCYTNNDINSNFNNTLHDVLKPMVNNNERKFNSRPQHRDKCKQSWQFKFQQ